eukprot:TRINITY_DN34301_c0_g1_i2.p1 TRINITY_DN34301_c0_g1~~TRINITY_DN34301_c0_g1_i2.p1  ORF type:complete len:148 (+),score=22.82 TRINITY_DN34301_c0_g1_i2:56-499(+)
MLYFHVFFFKQKTAYEMLRSLVGSEMCIRDSSTVSQRRGLDSVFCTIYEESDTVQRDEIMRRSRDVDGRINWICPSTIGNNTTSTTMGPSAVPPNTNNNSLHQSHHQQQLLLSTSCDGLYLLTSVGGIAWRKRWLDAVEGWLLGRRG